MRVLIVIKEVLWKKIILLRIVLIWLVRIAFNVLDYSSIVGLEITIKSLVLTAPRVFLNEVLGKGFERVVLHQETCHLVIFVVPESLFEFLDFDLFFIWHFEYLFSFDYCWFSYCYNVFFILEVAQIIQITFVVVGLQMKHLTLDICLQVEVSNLWDIPMTRV